MTHDAQTYFKTSRSLWFPVSVNAMILGTVGIIVFHLATALLCLASGEPGATQYRLMGFPVAVTELITHVHWPGNGDWVFCAQLLIAYVLWARLAPAIARITAVRIARDQYITLGEALRFSGVHFNTALLHIPAVALPAAFCACVVILIGAISQFWAPLWILGALLLPIAVLCTALAGALVLVGTLAMFYTPGAIAVEGKRTYDGLGKTFNYLLARPFSALTHLALIVIFFRVLNAGIFGDLRDRTASLLGVLNFIDTSSFRDIVRGNSDVDGPVATFAAWLWNAMWWLLEAVITGALLSWAIAACTSSWLILRQDIDGNDVGHVVDTAELSLDPSWESKKD